MKKWISIAVALWVMVPAVVVHAAYITSPDSVSISDPLVMRYLAEDGDRVVTFRYDVAYSGSYPTTRATSTIEFRLLASDNSTILQQASPYANPFFESNGYGTGMGAFYFSAADNYTWNQAAFIQIVQLPAFFSPAITTSYQLTPSDYVSETTQDANRELLKDAILNHANKLESDYSATGITLHTNSDIGIILSPYGELYFGRVMVGLQAMVPTLYFVQTLIPEAMTTAGYDSSLEDTLTARLTDDDMGQSLEDTAGLFNMGAGAFLGLICFASTIGLSVFTQRKGWGIEAGLLLASILVIGLAFLFGSGLLTVVMIISLVAGIGIVYLVLLRKA